MTSRFIPPCWEMVRSASDISGLLQAHQRGDAKALDRLIPLVYDDLCALARGQLRRRRPGRQLDTASLVHRVYVKLADGHGLRAADREHFFAVAATAMRHVLVDLARGRSRLKRGGDAPLLGLDEVTVGAREESELILAVHEALGALGRVDDRLVKVVECRFFAGFTDDETAEVLGISRATVQRDWIRARSWLREAIRAAD